MKRKRTVLSIAFLLAAWIGVQAGCANAPSHVTHVASVKFGLVQSDGTILETRNIQHKAGTEYGWLLDVTSTAAEVRIKEVLELPGPAAWGTPPPVASGVRRISHSISEDQRTQMEEFAVDARSGFSLQEKYIIAAGDPVGDHKLTLLVDGQRFDVQFTISE
jgi:hypothetical protein